MFQSGDKEARGVHRFMVMLSRITLSYRDRHRRGAWLDTLAGPAPPDTPDTPATSDQDRG